MFTYTVLPKTLPLIFVRSPPNFQTV